MFYGRLYQVLRFITINQWETDEVECEDLSCSTLLNMSEHETIFRLRRTTLKRHPKKKSLY